MKLNDRITSLESTSRRVNNDNEQKILEGAIARILAALRLALPSDETKSIPRANGCGTISVFDRHQKFHMDKLGELADRIENCTITKEDKLIFSSISARDLQIYGGKSAEEVIKIFVALEREY